MKKTKLSALVVLLILGFAMRIPVTITVSSLQEESESASLTILGSPGDLEIFAPTLCHNVTVYRDNFGVPHIYSQETSDAFYALGYVMAQDRLFEMDFIRRATAGRLAELTGNLMFQTDVAMRTLGIYKIAEDTWNGVYPNVTVSTDARKNLEQFSRGVNDYIAGYVKSDIPNTVPYEYRLLYAQGLPYEWILPYNWTPPDTLSITGYMGWDLTDSSQAEIMRGAFATNVDPVFAAQGLPGMTDFLMPTGWINMTTIMPPGCVGDGFGGSSGFQGVASSLKEMLGFPGLAGSNNWVVNGSITESGNAMLANDPHLNLQFPGIWYELHMKTDEFNAIGVTVPGAPIVPLGHNDYFAFGVTNIMTDILDLYYYVFDQPYPNCTQYWYIDHWEPITITNTTILNITTPVTLPILSTRHGPLIDVPGAGTFAFRWAGREFGYGEITGFTEMLNATNLAEWRQSLNHMSVIAQNYVYADKEGNIAWSPSGAIPVRDPSGGLTGVPTFGVVPSNGSAGQNEWLGWIPRATSPAPVPGYPSNVSLPYCENPDQGFIVTANNQPIDPGYPGYPWPVWIGPAYTYDPGYRGQRITELIQSLAPLNIDDMKAIQNDHLSIPARNFMPYILGTMAGDTNATIQQALGILAAWNFTELRNMVAPLIFEVWYDMYEQNTFADEFGSFGLYPFANMIIPLWNMTQTAAWNPYAIVLFDDKNTPSAGSGMPGWETMPEIVNRSLHDALDWIASQLGSNMSNWQYGNLHVVQFEHFAFGSFAPCLNVPPDYSLLPPSGLPWGTGPVGCDGGPYTVNPGGHYHKLVVNQSYFYVENGASYRGIYECKDDWGNSLILVPPGESGLVEGSVFAPKFNPHYNDTFLLWLNHQYTPCLFNDTTIQTVYETKITFYGVQLNGDVNGDGIINIVDVVIAAIAFGSAAEDDPETPWDETANWNPEADLNGDGIIDIVDLVIIGVNFGKTSPGIY